MHAQPQPIGRTVVDGFELLEELGRGGMGAVYKARELSSGRFVAFKVALGEGQSPERLARLEREGQLAASLNHPGIVRIHAAGHHRGIPYLAYELVEGVQEWSEVILALGQSERVALIRDVARALGAAHAQGIVHRDVKPDNLLVDKAGRVRVADFGLAVAQDVDRLTKTGAMLGTPRFMAPEQFETNRAGVGPPADVWALGVILYVAVTGKEPFEAASLYEMVALVEKAQPKRPRALNPAVSAPLEAVCLKALERDPAARYETGSAFADDLDRLLRGDSVVARGAVSLRRAVPLLRWAIGPAVGVLVLAGAYLYEPASIEADEVAAPTPAATATPSESEGEEDWDEDEEDWDEDNSSEARLSRLRDGYDKTNEVPELATEADRSLLAGVLESTVQGVFSESNDNSQEGRALAELHRAKLKDATNRVAAFEHYRKSAELGNSQAMRKLGDRTRDGDGVEKNRADALKWYVKSAEAGDREAMILCAEWLHKGKGDTRDRKAAYGWWLKAAELGHKGSMVKVSREFLRGKYLEKNPKEVVFWKESAIAKGIRWIPEYDTPPTD